MSILGMVGDALDSASDRFGQLDGRFLLPALALQLLTLVFRALAWRGVLVAAYPGRRVSALSVERRATRAGVAMNAFTPARGGELSQGADRADADPDKSPSHLAASLTVVLQSRDKRTTSAHREGGDGRSLDPRPRDARLRELATAGRRERVPSRPLPRLRASPRQRRDPAARVLGDEHSAPGKRPENKRQELQRERRQEEAPVELAEPVGRGDSRASADHSEDAQMRVQPRGER